MPSFLKHTTVQKSPIPLTIQIPKVLSHEKKKKILYSFYPQKFMPKQLYHENHVKVDITIKI